MFSPDGHWVAYQIKEPGSTGTEGVTYVQPFPPTGKKNQIVARWAADVVSRRQGAVLRAGTGRFMAVTVRTAPSFTFTNPVAVPRGFVDALPANPRTFDILPDGGFVVVGTQGQSQSTPGPTQIHVVLNWFEELKRLVPTK